MCVSVFSFVGLDYSFPVDVWAVGITVIEMVDTKPPLFDLLPLQALHMIGRPDHNPTVANPSRSSKVGLILNAFLLTFFTPPFPLLFSLEPSRFYIFLFVSFSFQTCFSFTTFATCISGRCVFDEGAARCVCCTTSSDSSFSWSER